MGETELRMKSLMPTGTLLTTLELQKNSIIDPDSHGLRPGIRMTESLAKISSEKTKLLMLDFIKLQMLLILQVRFPTTGQLREPSALMIRIPQSLTLKMETEPKMKNSMLTGTLAMTLKAQRNSIT